jgi:transcriptional regulator with XRE-family HTH domain
LHNKSHGVVQEEIGTLSHDLHGTLTSLHENQERLYHILEDGKITDQEWRRMGEVIPILKELSTQAKALHLWAVQEKLWTPPEGEPTDESASECSTPLPYASARRERYTSSVTAAKAVNMDRAKLSGIENGKITPSPEEVSRMAKAYHAPQLYDYYCAQECQFRKNLHFDTKPLESENLALISLQLLAALHYLEGTEETLRAVLEDGEITSEEEADFARSLQTLDKVSYSADSLSLWMQRTLAERAKELLADDQITRDEREEFVALLQKLSDLGYDTAYIQGLKNYLK